MLTAKNAELYPSLNRHRLLLTVKHEYDARRLDMLCLGVKDMDKVVLNPRYRIAEVKESSKGEKVYTIKTRVVQEKDLKDEDAE